MANWLDFNKVSEFSEDWVSGYNYDEITDSQIKRALADNKVIVNIDTTLDWQCDSWLSQLTTVPESSKHSYRVAAIVRELQSGGQLNSAITIDTFSSFKCCNSIPDGHHRVRALQYLGMTCGPFSLGGDCDILEALVEMAGVSGPGIFSNMFSSKLLEVCCDDIGFITA